MKELYPLFGIVTVLNTPFRDDHSIDYGALKRNVRYALDAGVAGFLVPAMASEVYKLSFGERLKMVEAVLGEVNGRVPVFAGAGEPDPARGKEIMRAYRELGCSHFLLQIPFENNGQFRSHFLELAETGTGIIMLQDWDTSGYGLPDQLIYDLFEEVEAFRCLKIETVPAGAKYSRILELTGGRLNLSGGWAVMQMTEGLIRGVHAFMPTGMHLIYCEIYRLWSSGNREEASQLFRRILPVLAFSNQHLDISVHFFKHLLFRQGVYPTPLVREPVLPFDVIHRQMADRLIEGIIELENEIQWKKKSI